MAETLRAVSWLLFLLLICRFLCCHLESLEIFFLAQQKKQGKWKENATAIKAPPLLLLQLLCNIIYIHTSHRIYSLVDFIFKTSTVVSVHTFSFYYIHPPEWKQNTWGVSQKNATTIGLYAIKKSSQVPLKNPHCQSQHGSLSFYDKLNFLSPRFFPFLSITTTVILLYNCTRIKRLPCGTTACF